MAKRKRWKPDLATLSVREDCISRGISVYSIFSPELWVPLGTVWFYPTSNAYNEIICEVLDVYVINGYRRQGVATWVMKLLLDQYGMLRTGRGSKDGGRALLKSMKWKQDKVSGDWYLRGKVQKICEK
jgi:hypothetical protein